MARISGLSRPTVYAGVRQLDEQPDPHGRVRGPGGGPKRLVERQPGLLRSTRQLADALGAQGFQVSDDTVGRLLKQQGYTLQPID